MITYDDKILGQANSLPENQKWTFANANEVKSVVNANLHWRGGWESTTVLPVDADGVGSGTNGAILGGNEFYLINGGTYLGSFFQAKSIAKALQANPTTLDHWSILAPQS